MSKIIECVPNFSEGRRPAVVEAIRKAMAIPGVHILNVSSDHDHNRSVITIAGTPEVIEQAAFNGIAKAAELIDLETHRGEHPRIGATDVVPFVPVADVTMDDCIDIAKRLGERVGSELNIPVYLYESAATRPNRVDLANIRRGEYEQLKQEIGRNPDRQPDYGPSTIGPAGATVIGARPFLIAYNIYLNSEDVSIAKAIAKVIRHSNGGLRFVKALGLSVEGKAQVSINLTDYRKTSIARVVEMVRREAARHGCAIVKSELIGLAPQAALLDAAQWYLQLDDLKPDQVLENQLRDAEGGSITPLAFLEATAAGTATPGGGAVAALAAALAAALTTMVARLTIGKKKYAEVESQMKEIASQANALRARLTQAIEDDSVAFDALMAAFRLPKDSDEQKAERDQQIQIATQRAIDVPLFVARACLDVLELARRVAEGGNLNALTDAGSAAHLARAAVECAALNVRVNATSLSDKPKAQTIVEEINTIRQRAASLSVSVNVLVEERAALA